MTQIWLKRNSNWYSWTNIHPEKHQRLHGTTITILYKRVEKYCGNFSYFLTWSHFATILCSPRHWIWLMWNMYEHISTNINPWKYQRIYGITIFILYKMGEEIVIILHTYEARAIFLLFYDHQGTESELCEI